MFVGRQKTIKKHFNFRYSYIFLNSKVFIFDHVIAEKTN